MSGILCPAIIITLRPWVLHEAWEVFQRTLRLATNLLKRASVCTTQPSCLMVETSNPLLVLPTRDIRLIRRPVWTLWRLLPLPSRARPPSDPWCTRWWINSSNPNHRLCRSNILILWGHPSLISSLRLRPSWPAWTLTRPKSGMTATFSRRGPYITRGRQVRVGTGPQLLKGSERKERSKARPGNSWSA